MAAEENNQWWRKRSKHGRSLIFSSPELMWEAACEYFESATNSDYLKKQEIGWFQGTATIKEVVCAVPFTWEGLCLYFGCGHAYFRTRRYEINKKKKEGIADEVDEDFLTVMNMIDMVIFKNQFEGGQAGVFREGLTARYLKLSDKTELSTSNEEDKNEFVVTLKLD